MDRIQRALLSCYDKTGVVNFAQVLSDFGVDIIATEGTRNVLAKAGIKASGIADFTGLREMMDGRVKSLHPKIHAGLLGIRDNKLHVDEMQTYECQWIDLVAVNFHPLADLIQNHAGAPEEVMEQVDIGGVAMIRSAAKNFRYVGVAVNPSRYPTIAHELHAHDGNLPFTLRFRLAQEAFAVTAQYDAALSEFLLQCEPPEE